MEEKNIDDSELVDGFVPRPEHASWIRIAAYNNILGLVIFIVLAVAFVFVINLHLRPGELTAVMIFGGIASVALMLWMAWKTTPIRRRGVVGNAVLTTHVKADLVTELGADHINVDSSNGVVTLTGTIPYADFRSAAVDIARRRGASQVIDSLQVEASIAPIHDSYLHGYAGVTTPEGAPNVAMPLERVLREALEDDPRVNAYVLTSRVDDGVAYLEGRQETVQASEAAAEVASNVPGILSVSNDIEIMPSV